MKQKHSLMDLNEYLFNELDALTNDDLKGGRSQRRDREI